MPYFEALGYVVPTFENPSDFYMRAMQVDGAALTAAWTESSNEQQGGTPSEKEAVAPWDPQGKWLLRPEAKSRRAQATACGWHQYCVLLRRFLADSYKDKGKMLSSFVMEGTIGLLIGLVWYNQDVRDSGSAFAIAGVFIMLTTIAIFDNCLSVGLKFPLTRALHFREFRCGVLVVVLGGRRQRAYLFVWMVWHDRLIGLGRRDTSLPPSQL